MSKSASLFLRKELRWSTYTVSKQRWYPTGAQLLQKAFGGTGGMDEIEA